jgi:hypothetical protein
MRKLIPEKPVQPGSGQGTQKNQDDNREAGPDLRENRAGTSARKSPTNTKKEAAENLTLIELFGVKDNRIPRRWS